MSDDTNKGYIKIKKWKFFLLLFVVFIIGGVFMPDSNTSSKTYDTEKSSVSVDTSKSTTVEKTEEQKEPIAEKAEGKVDVKSHTKKPGDSYNAIVGEVENNTDEAVDTVKVTVTYYDGAEAVVATGFAYAVSFTDSPLLPGETTPFEVSSFPDQVQVASYKIDVDW